MKHRISLPLFLLLAAGCGGSGSEMFYGESHPPLRTLCQATDVPLVLVTNVVCQSYFPSPREEDPEFFSDHKPKSSRYEELDGTRIQAEEYDYDRLIEDPHATYNDDDNIIAVTVPELFIQREKPVFEFEYRGSTLIGAHALMGGVRLAETDIKYKNGVRASEGLKTSERTRWFYRYDAGGRLIAKLGGGAIGRLPEAPSEAVLAMGCSATVPPVDLAAEGDFGLTGAEYYFRDEQGRISTIISGVRPGFLFEKFSFVWSGDRLESVTQECVDPSLSYDLPPQRVIFYY